VPRVQDDQRGALREYARAVHEIEHHIYDCAAHISAAAHSGFTLSHVHEGAIGPSVEHFYASAGRHDVYLRDFGLPVVAVSASSGNEPMRLLIEAANTTIAVEDGAIVEPSGSFDQVVRAPRGEVRPG